MTADQAPTGSLARTWLAIFVGWLCPGAGHLVLGRMRRGLLFAVIVWGGFGLGMAHEGRLALRDPRQPLLTTLQIVANLGVGPADLIARKMVYDEIAYTMPPQLSGTAQGPRLQTFRERDSSGVSIYGTAYLWTAGLMNLLLLFDLWDIGRQRKA